MLKKLLNKKLVSLGLPFLISLMALTKVFGAVTDTQKDTIFKLTSIFENSTTTLQYTYVENIGDGRGLTFGFAGFCSGTYDGTMFLKEYRTLNPNNILVKYIPAFERIDSLPHPGGYTAWAPNTYYAVGSIVSYGGSNYKCIQAHTSLTGWEPPVVPALWQLQ